MISKGLIAVLLFASSAHQEASGFQVKVSQPTTRQCQLAALNAIAPKVQNDCANRRSFLVASTTAFAGFLSTINPASAKYGDSTNIELPNYIDFLIEKNNAGKIDEEKVLYKGADPVVLLKRLQEADKRLGEIAALSEEKKWSQIQGIVTGPLGTLSQTLNQIATAPDASPKVKEQSKKLKAVVIDIGQAASKKNGAACASKAEQASQELNVFVRAAFQ